MASRPEHLTTQMGRERFYENRTVEVLETVRTYEFTPEILEFRFDTD